MVGYYRDAEATAAGRARRLVPHRRPRRAAPRRLRRAPRPGQGRDHLRRREHLVGRGRAGAARATRRCSRRPSSPRPTRSWGEVPVAYVTLAPAPRRPRGSWSSTCAYAPGPVQGAQADRVRTSCPRRPPARSRSSPAASARVARPRPPHQRVTRRMIPPLVDHLVLIVPDLDATCARLAGGHGIQPVVGGRHPADGTRNRLVRLGPATYLEILAIDPAADPGVRSPRGELVAATPCDRLHEVLLHVADFDAMVDQVTANDPFEVTGVFRGGRERLDGSRVEWRRAEMRAAAGAPLPDVIDWITPHPATSLPVQASLEELTLTVPDPPEARAALDAIGDPSGLVLARRGPRPPGADHHVRRHFAAGGMTGSVAVGGGGPDPDGLDVAELADAVRGQLAAVTRVLDAAERERGIEVVIPLTNTWPASSSRTNRSRSSGSVVQTFDPSPNWWRWRARSPRRRRRRGRATATGPNTSSANIRMSGVTPATTVGG